MSRWMRFSQNGSAFGLEVSLRDVKNSIIDRDDHRRSFDLWSSYFIWVDAYMH